MHRAVLLTSILTGILASALPAQISPRPSVQATGNATVYSQPDQATIDVTASASGTSAADAAAKDATQANGLVAALTKLIGANGKIQTASYWVYPTYSNTPANVITGYTANTTIEVTMYDLTLAGPVIDTAVANGGTSVGGIGFSLKDPEPQKEQALRMATQQAM